MPLNVFPYSVIIIPLVYLRYICCGKQVKNEERKPTRCNNIDGLLSVWMLVIDNVSTCFGHLYAHLQEQRPRVTAYEVYLLVMLNVAGCGAVVLH